MEVCCDFCTFLKTNNYFNCSLLVHLQLLNFKLLSSITVAIIDGNFDRATNPHPHPTDFAHGWLRHIPI